MNMKSLSIAPILLLMVGCGGVARVATSTATSTTSPVTVSTTTPTGPVTLPQIHGMAKGGQQPVGGMSLQLYTVGTAGYGSASTPVGSAFTTNAQGEFYIPASAICASGTELIYLVGTGGTVIAAAGSTPATTNPNLKLMVGLGSCNNISSNTARYIEMNELTTVASVWALSPFMTDYAHIGSSSTNPTGIQNAFASINNLVDTSTGYVATAGGLSPVTLPGTATPPTAMLNTLGNILAQCVNSAGGTAGDGSNCGSLFADAGSTNSTGTVTDTLAAALLIAQNPSTNVSNLCMLAGRANVFPNAACAVTPTSLSLVITYAIPTALGQPAPTPQAVAPDQSGNVWIANSGNNSVLELSPVGATLQSVTTNINAPYALAIDQSGNAWVANSGNNSVAEIGVGTTQSAVYNNTTNQLGFNVPKGIAIDGSGDVWVTNSGNGTVSAFFATGTPGVGFTGSPFSTGSITAPMAIAINPE
jgi:hypothetical protein